MDENAINTGSGQGLVEFLTYASRKGLLNKNTAGALRAAAREVLTVENEDLSSVDVRQLDIEDLARRFANVRSGKFTPQSLEAYQSRFRKSVEMYLRFLDNPAGWRPDIRTRASGEKRSRGTSENGSGGTGTGAGTAQDSGAPLPPPASSGLIQYPFPIREGVIANLTLPLDLRKAEAKRLAAFLDSLAVEELRALPPGNPEGGAD